MNTFHRHKKVLNECMQNKSSLFRSNANLFELFFILVKKHLHLLKFIVFCVTKVAGPW